MEQNHVYIHEDCRAMVQLFQPPKPRTKNLWDLFESYWIPLVHRASFAATHTTNPSAYHQPERTPRRGVGCTWHMGRGSRTYLDPFALQGSNRVQPSLSYTNLTSDFRPRTLRVIFFRICPQKLWNFQILWNMAKVEFSPERVQKTHTIAFQCARVKTKKQKTQN